MKKIEYKTKCVDRYYQGRGMEDRSPEQDTLTKMGEEGWVLCAVSHPDFSGSVEMYFMKEIIGD